MISTMPCQEYSIDGYRVSLLSNILFSIIKGVFLSIFIKQYID